MNRQVTIPLNCSPDEAFARLSIGRTSGWTHIKLGNIKVVYMGRLPKVPVEEVDRVAREGLPRLTKDVKVQAETTRTRTTRKPAKKKPRKTSVK